jgi:hypothetical protein
MARFLIEVPHEDNRKACALAVKILLSSGSHYLTHADYGCLDGEHKAWIIIEADSKQEARLIIPPVYRQAVKVVKLNKFSLKDIDEILEQHQE